MPIALGDAFLYLGILAIFIEALWDYFHSVEISPVLILIPFILGLISIFFQSQYLVLLLAIALVAFSEIRVVGLRRVSVLVCIIAFIAIRWDAGLFILAFWLLYEFNLLGGADSLACFSLLLIRPDWLLGWWLLMGMGLGAWWIGVRRHGFAYFKKLVQSWRDISSKPASEQQLLEEGPPFLWTVVAGSLLYVLVNALLQRA